MKRILAGCLMLAVTLSLLTTGVGAAEYDALTDKDEIQYAEAVAVISKLGIVGGYADGSFKPEGTLTRGAAAKIISTMMLGAEGVAKLRISAAPYSDVPADHTFASVINYCKTNGYISGYNDGTFRPADTLTGYAFAKMLLGALGYDANIEGYTGEGWTERVYAQGDLLGLFQEFSGGFNGGSELTREGACLMALNTLMEESVTYEDGSAVCAFSEDPAVSHKLIADDALQFGEIHFPSLRRTTSGDPANPTRTWTLNGETFLIYTPSAPYDSNTEIARQEFQGQVIETSADPATYDERLADLDGYVGSVRYSPEQGMGFATEAHAENGSCIGWYGVLSGNPRPENQLYLRFADSTVGSLPLPAENAMQSALPTAIRFEGDAFVYEVVFSENAPSFNDSQQLLHMAGTYRYTVDLAAKTVSLKIAA